MKGFEFWARAHAACWSLPPPSQEAQDALAHAHRVGFKLGREKAAKMIERFGNPKFDGVPLLIRAIGTAEVDENGNAIYYDEPVPAEEKS